MANITPAAWIATMGSRIAPSINLGF